MRQYTTIDRKTFEKRSNFGSRESLFLAECLLWRRLSTNVRSNNLKKPIPKQCKIDARKNEAHMMQHTQKRKQTWFKNGAPIHPKSIKNKSENRCRQMDVQTSIQIPTANVTPRFFFMFGPIWFLRVSISVFRNPTPSLFSDKYSFCDKCFGDIPGEYVSLGDDPSQPQT